MSELEAQIANRKSKRDELESLGVEPYPARVEYDLEPSKVHQRFGERSAEELEAGENQIRVPGRLRAIRKHGKTSFLDLHDGNAKLQVMVRHQKLSESGTQIFDKLDVGDYVLADGFLLRTRTGELTLLANDISLLAKAVRPLPEKWHGLTDVESRYRRRYLDLLFNDEARRVFETRAAIIQTLRDQLNRAQFLEVETPMMQALPGGATALPFVTHHNALDIELYLRVAPELYLKRLLVGGFHRVYEINRSFRNEGISTRHNPEFTMLEFYWAYSDYQQLMDFTESMLNDLAVAVVGQPSLDWQGERLELSGSWPRYTIKEAITHFAGIDPSRLDRLGDLASVFREREIPLPEFIDDPNHPALETISGPHPIESEPEAPEGWYGRLLMELFELTVEELLIQPTFITDHPVEVSPLAKPRSDDKRFTERFELYIGGMEIANAFSELNDPQTQAQRFREQIAAREKGDSEAHRFDHDYIMALEHGMPPAGGEGIGIDRLTMLFTDSASIRDVILFPLMRPEATSDR